MRLIDADALFERAFEIWGIEADASYTNIFMEAINDAPTIDAEPVKHSGWVYDAWHKGFICLACHKEWVLYKTDKGDFDFCPYCGA